MENTNVLHHFSGQSQIFDWASSLLLLLSTSPELNNGVFTNFSLEPTWRWYFAMTPFEAFFLGIILTQFAVLNLFGIFPLNLSALINGMPSGRKKRETFELTKKRRDIASELLKLMKKLDPDECSFKAICELEIQSCIDNSQIPQSVIFTLKGLKQLSKKRTKDSNSEKSLTSTPTVGSKVDDENDVIALYEEAVKIGDDNSYRNASGCGHRYPRCAVNRAEIMDYMRIMESVDGIFDLELSKF